MHARHVFNDMPKKRDRSLMHAHPKVHAHIHTHIHNTHICIFCAHTCRPIHTFLCVCGCVCLCVCARAHAIIMYKINLSLASSASKRGRTKRKKHMRSRPQSKCVCVHMCGCVYVWAQEGTSLARFLSRKGRENSIRMRWRPRGNHHSFG
jgi:hypothetical protein